MNGVNGFVASILEMLRGVVSDPLGLDWVWTVVLLGIGVGLLPAAGALIVAIVRKGIGSRYGVVESIVLIGIGVLSAGLLPLLVFTSTGRTMARAYDGAATTGLSDSSLSELGASAELIGSQAQLLGDGTVADAFNPSIDPLRFGIALLLLALVPLLTGMLVAAQARLALRRGPSWPSKFFWIPSLAVGFLTFSQPAGASAALWLGALGGALVGVLVVMLAGVPSREAVRRSLEPQQRRPEPARPEPARPEPRRAPERIVSAPPGARPSAGDGRKAAAPTKVDVPIGSSAQASAALQDRMAQRFAERPVQPPVTAKAPASVPGPRKAPPPTMVGPVPGIGGGARRPSGPRFTPIRRLGQGGFGRVWLAHDAKLGHTVALKAAHAPDAETEQRIQREAFALRTIDHPNSVKIYDLLPAASDPGLSELEGMVIVMEFVDGMSLGELVRGRGLLDDRAAAQVWSSVGGALDAAHAQGVMHRDVKPGNIVVDDKDRRAHLIDFGIARRTGDATMTMAGFVLGTPDFLAPEIAAGGKATPQSDSWQLAATVSYALTGQPPRGAHSDPVSGLRAAAAGAPLKHLPPHSAHLALLKVSLDTEPSRRPPLRDVQRALLDWLRRTGVRPDGPVTEVFTRTV